MKLRRIDVLGFKSFRTKTGLEISDGVTAVVGPNGCGKSNIVDAIRWSIGSQSPKDLRGRAMEDVIFAGSENHRPMGFAEVKLTLENDGYNVPVEWKEHAEIAVCRRLFRTGESEYEINGSKVRLRDIHQLFLGTGVGAKEAYSIIEQGRIGFIVSARPEERRVLIEEAAGITRYKFQRQSAQRRLDKTRDNLVRVEDVLSEVERQVSSLQRQARKAARWRTFTERKRELEVRAALQRRDVAHEKVRTANERLTLIKNAWQLTKVGHERAQALIEERRTQLAVHEHAFNDAMEVAYQTKARRDLLKNNVQHQERELAGLRERTVQIQARRSEQSALLEQAQSDLSRTSESLTAALAQADSLAKALDAELVALSEVRGREATLVGSIDAASRRLVAARSTIASAEAKTESALRERDQLQARLNELSERQRELTITAESAELAESFAQTELASARQRHQAAQTRLESAREAERSALAALESQRRAERQAKAASDSASAKVRALQGVLTRGEGYGSSVRTVLKAIDRGELTGIGRPVAERLRVAPENMPRLGGALDSALDALVADSEQAAVAFVAWARARKLRTAVVWGPMVEGQLTPWCTSAEPVPAVVAELLADAGGQDPLHGAEGRAVSSDGVVVRQRAGWVTLGGDTSEAGGVVQLAAELDSARATAEGAAAIVPRVEAAVGAAETTLEQCLQVRTGCSEALQSAEVERRQAVESHRDAVAVLDRVTREAAQANNDATGARSRLSILAGRASEAEGQRTAALASMAEVEQIVGAQQAELPEARAAVQHRSDAVAEAKASVARIRERSSSLRSNRDRLERTLRGADLDGRNLAGESAKIGARTAEIEGSLSADRRALTVSDESTAASEAKLESTRKHHDAAITAVREAEAETHVARKSFNDDAERLRQSELAAERAKTELKHADAGLSERFQITLAAAREVAGSQAFGPEEAAELKNVSDRLAGLGAVNPAAEEEYEEAKERYEFLHGQKSDLETAMADLESAIRKMDQTSRELFSETFEAVNAGFMELFPRLFEGGQGRMELTEPDNLLETGIDIIVQPPGKRLQSMTLLSGGEKALTAVALILSIFRLKPTPFCILDEVDAPLDEANVVRFAEAVAGLSETTQFLVITHNKRTMEVANTLYGVTMEEPGVSKVVGVRMPSRREPAEPAHSTTTH